MKTLYAAAAMALALGLASQSHAATETFSFSGTNSQGAFSGLATIDVEGGYATSGSGTISGAGLGSDTLTLITALTPGAENVAADGTFGYRSNGGDDVLGVDDAVPVNGNGIIFGVGSGAVSPGSDLLVGAYSNGDGTYSNFFYGNSSTGTRFYEQGGPVTIVETAISAAPEPSAWILMLGSVGLAGLVLRRRRATSGALSAA